MIKCVNCCPILNSPVLLPCGHSICKHHAETTSDTMIKCGKCGRDHLIPSEGFINQESLAAIIETEFYSINLGEENEQAKTDYETLEMLINQVNSFLADPTYQTREKIDDIKNKIYLKREQVKLEIDQETDKLIDKLDQYVKKLLTQLDENEFKQTLSELDSINRAGNTKLNEFKKQLNLVSLDEAKWENISEQIISEQKKISGKLRSIRQSLIKSDFEDIQADTRLFLEFRWSSNW